MATDTPSHSRIRIFLAIILAIVTLISLAPFFSVLTASLLAGYFHCRAGEDGAHPCPAFGTDIGDLIYTLGVLGWLMLITIPVFLCTVAGWIVLYTTRPKR